MSEPTDNRQQLAAHIARRRSEINSYLRRAKPRRKRLVNVSVTGSTLAAAVTVGPSVGGTDFTSAVQSIFSLANDSTVWRILCLCAVFLSVGAALATNLSNSHSASEHLSAAEAASAELDGLESAVAFGHLPIEDAVKLYGQYTAKVSFISQPPGG